MIILYKFSFTTMTVNQSLEPFLKKAHRYVLSFLLIQGTFETLT